MTVPRRTPADRRAANANGRGACAPPDGSAGADSPRIVVKYAHVSKSPRRARSVAPSVCVEPRVPSTTAVTIRGETPRLVTRMPRNEPR